MKCVSGDGYGRFGQREETRVDDLYAIALNIEEVEDELDAEAEVEA